MKNNFQNVITMNQDWKTAKKTIYLALEDVPEITLY